MFTKICGPNALKNVVLGHTIWDQVSIARGKACEKELVSTLKKREWMAARGGRVYRDRGMYKSYLNLIEYR